MRAHSTALVFHGCAALALTWTAVGARALAEPTLHVRAATRLELHARSEEAGLRVSGMLRDDLDVALPGRPLRLRIDPEPAADGGGPSAGAAPHGWARALRTDAAGRFSLHVALPLGRYELTAEYDGDASHERSRIEHGVDVALAELNLELHLPAGRVIDLDRERFDVALRAKEGEQAAHLALVLRDETGRELASASLDAGGAWHGSVPTQALGEPGPGTLIASTRADARRAGAEVRATRLRERASELQLRAAWDDEREQLQLAGELRTRAGPLPGKAVGVYLDRRHAVTLTSDARGRIEHALDAAGDASGLLARDERVQAQTRHVSARFDSDVPGLRGARTTEQALTIPAWTGPNLLWVILPSLLSLVGVGLWLRRSGAWLGPTAAQDVFAPGVQLGAAAQWRPANLRGLDGVIEDAETGVRLRQATLVLARGAERGRVHIEADGSFAIAELAPGLYRLEASAPGYETASTELKLPHAGEGAGLRVRLRDLRTLALEAHRPLLRTLFATREEQLAATPREALRRAEPLVPSPLPASVTPASERAGELTTLTALVERTAYSADTPTDAQIQAIERQTDALIKRSG